MTVKRSEFLDEMQRLVAADAARMKYCILATAVRVFDDVTIALEVTDKLTNGSLNEEDPEDIREIVLAYMR